MMIETRSGTVEKAIRLTKDEDDRMDKKREVAFGFLRIPSGRRRSL